MLTNSAYDSSYDSPTHITFDPGALILADFTASYPLLHLEVGTALPNMSKRTGASVPNGVEKATKETAQEPCKRCHKNGLIGYTY